jgi:hypothetical protein
LESPAKLFHPSGLPKTVRWLVLRQVSSHLKWSRQSGVIIYLPPDNVENYKRESKRAKPSFIYFPFPCGEGEQGDGATIIR